MLALFALALEEGSCVILSGDTRQHGPVEASDALRAIERYAGIRPAELNSIRRQDPTRGRTPDEKTSIALYRAAVKAAAEGDSTASFDALEKLGAITECAPTEQSRKLVEAYLALANSGESALVISQT